jgi:hypothetical protein
MDARVGAAGDGERGERAVELAESPLQLALDGSQPGLRSPAVEAASVVLEREAQPHTTIIAA